MRIAGSNVPLFTANKNNSGLQYNSRLMKTPCITPPWFCERCTELLRCQTWGNPSPHSTIPPFTPNIMGGVFSHGLRQTPSEIRLAYYTLIPKGVIPSYGVVDDVCQKILHWCIIFTYSFRCVFPVTQAFSFPLRIWKYLLYPHFDLQKKIITAITFSICF